MDVSDVLDIYEVYKLYVKYKNNRKRKAKIWIHRINQHRDEWGAFSKLMPQLKDDVLKFQNYCRMSKELFYQLLTKIREDIRKEDTNFRKAIEPELKLMLTLRYLATGQSFQSLHYQFRVGQKTARQAVYDVCTAIWKQLSPTEMPPPTKETMLQISQRFFELWQFPNCLGAIDGKHVKLKCPSLSGTQYFNYKGTFSIVLQAVADADGLFQYVDVGDYGRHCDAGVFKYSNFGKAFSNGSLPIPEDASICGSEPLPFVFLGDEAYPLHRHLMKPFSRRDLDTTRRIYNYRQSRARRVVECAFGMLTAKWGALKTVLTVTPEHARIITLACCVLHNFVRRREGRDYSSDFEFTDETINASDERTNFGRPTKEALKIRDRFAAIITDDLTVPWQAKSAFIE